MAKHLQCCLSAFSSFKLYNSIVHIVTVFIENNHSDHVSVVISCYFKRLTLCDLCDADVGDLISALEDRAVITELT